MKIRYDIIKYYLRSLVYSFGLMLGICAAAGVIMALFNWMADQPFIVALLVICFMISLVAALAATANKFTTKPKQKDLE